MSISYTEKGGACGDCIGKAAFELAPETAPEGYIFDAKRDRATRPNAYRCDCCDRVATKVVFPLTWASWTRLDI